jgi:SAM-dependent methyltransferase
LSDLYDEPKYYEIAFSFRDIPSEVDVFEECFRRFSNVAMKSVLELGCGNSPHIEELTKRGYKYNGLDLNKAMLDYSMQKALNIGAEVNLIQDKMAYFALDVPVDFVYINLGSLYVKNTSELTTHFDSVSSALRKGGLYLLDWCIQFNLPNLASEGGEIWEIEKEGIRVKTTVTSKYINLIEQTFEETIILEVDDHGKKFTITGKDIRRSIYPQEFLCFIHNRRDFEFVGWWNNWNLNEPLGQSMKINRPITLIRRI